MFDRIAPVYDVMNRVMTLGLDLRWRRIDRPGGRPAGRPRARRLLRHGGSRARRAEGGRHRDRPRLLAAHARACPAEGAERRPGSRATCSSCRSKTRPSTRPRSGSASATSPTSRARSPSCAASSLPGGRVGDPRDHAAAGPARAVLPGLVRPCRAAARKAAEGRRRLLLPAGERTPLPRTGGAGGADAGGRASTGSSGGPSRAESSPCTSDGPRDRRSRRSARRPGSTSTSRSSRSSSRRRSPRTRGSLPPWPGTRSTPAASACGRCSSSSRRRPGSSPSVAAGVAVELVHMATLVHDDLIDGAEFRRGRASAWSAYGPAAARATGRLPVRAGVRRAGGDGRRAGRLAARRRGALPRARRGDAATPGARPGHDRRRIPRALRAEDGEAVRGRLPPRRRQARAGRVRARARDRVPDHGRHPRLRRRDGRDRQDRRASTSARGRRRCR